MSTVPHGIARMQEFFVRLGYKGHSFDRHKTVDGLMFFTTKYTLVRHHANRKNLKTEGHHEFEFVREIRWKDMRYPGIDIPE